MVSDFYSSLKSPLIDLLRLRKIEVSDKESQHHLHFWVSTIRLPKLTLWIADSFSKK